MGLQNTPLAERLHIGIFGKRNAGKSSIINKITGQELAIVSDVKGTTTDPVLKTMELLPLGPVVIIDTPGLDDVGELGQLRIRKAHQMLNKSDIAIVVVDSVRGFDTEDERILEKIKAKGIPYLLVFNKADKLGDKAREDLSNVAHSIVVSTRVNADMEMLKNRLAKLVPSDENKPIIRDLLKAGDVVLLVTPIDASAPKGRLILPQQQTIRDILAADAIPILTKETTLKQSLAVLQKRPAMVVTDSQVFEIVAKEVPKAVPLTSFSILFARYKGSLDILADGVKALKQLPAEAHILICEGCTHHRQCEDIGTVKLPQWLGEYTGKDFRFSFCSGTEFPEDLQGYDFILHCGSCMLSEREMKYRMRCAKDAGVPITNYGTCIAYIKGILERALLPFR